MEKDDINIEIESTPYKWKAQFLLKTDEKQQFE